MPSIIGDTATQIRYSTRAPAALSDYLELARFDHITKQSFIVPGIIIACVLRGIPLASVVVPILVGFFSAICIASSNYVINEWLDREFDAHHPSKSRRASVRVTLNPLLVYLEYAILLLLGITTAYFVGPLFFITSICFAASGIIYNVSPLRSKDRVYMDVLTEALNNPLRLILGWAMVDPTTLPPSSLLLAYWMGGAFLMAAKRLSEYRDIAAGPGVAVLHRYRRSFQFYTEEKLTISCFFYALMASFFIAVFSIKYRAEYILAFPAFVILFALYFALSMQRDSVAQKPERLFSERKLMLAVAGTVGALLCLSFIDIPAMEQLSVPFLVGIEGRHE